MPSQQTRREDLETELRTESGLSGSLQQQRNMRPANSMVRK